MSSKLAVKVENLSKVYQIYERPQDRLKQMLWRGRRKFHDDFWALRDINFEVAQGETVGIVGRNGSGKSTLLQIICGTVTPTTGSVERNGRISALLELGSGFNPEFTGRENVFLNGSILGLNREDMESRFDKIAAFADIGNFIDSPVKHYSSGMFARLAFSVAIHVDPEVLIVDEILAVGDAAFQRRCLKKFYEIRDNGCSILFVSHDQYQIKSTCQRALYLEQGQQKMFASAAEVIDQYSIDLEEQFAQTTATQEKIEPNPHEAEIAQPTVEEEPPQLFRVTDVEFTDEHGNPLEIVTTDQTVNLRFNFAALVEPPPEKISFVFNLYRHDDLYLCGTTTLMDGIAPYQGTSQGRVSVKFPKFPLLSGHYKWRVAINDDKGLITYVEARELCPFRVQDDFKAVGLFNLCREWEVETVAELEHCGD